jgi:ubiquinone biosynthesis protein COQ9
MSFRRYLTGGTSTLIRSRETFITGLFNQQGRRSDVHVRRLRSYSSQTHASSTSPSGQSAQSAILSAALHHVPSHGFTQAALSRGANDAGYLDASLTLFPRGAFDLVNHYLVSQRLALGKNASSLDMNCGVGAKVRKLALLRLRSNSAVIHHWQEVRLFLLVLSVLEQAYTPSFCRSLLLQTSPRG